MSYNLNKNQPQLMKILEEPNPSRDVMIFKQRTGQKESALKYEYDKLWNMIYKRRDITQKNWKEYCGYCNRNHLLHFCNEKICENCGRKGHQRQICDTPTYYVNMTYLCECDGRNVKRNRTWLNERKDPKARIGTHCCYCNLPEYLYRMKKFGDRMQCEKCENQSKPRGRSVTKRDLTPPRSPRPSKRNTFVENNSSRQVPKTWAQVAQQKPDDQP